MSSPLPDLDALPHDGLKRLVAQLLGRVSVLEEENRQLRDENARLKDLPKRPQLAPGGMDQASGPDRQGTAKGARRSQRKARRGRRTPPITEERTLTVAAPPGSRRKGYEAGKQARDTFLGLLKTCTKLAVSFWDYLGARLKIPKAEAVPWLPDLIRQRAPA